MCRKVRILPALILLVLINLPCFADVAAEFDKPDAYGRTALIYAILNGDLDSVRSLLDKGADTHVKDKLEGKTILMTACEQYYSDDDNNGIKKQQDMIALLLDKGHVNIDERDKHGSTALMRVAYRGRQNVLLFLIKGGADVNASNNEGSTPLFVAIYGCHYESGCRYQIVKNLLDNGARANVKNESGHTPLYYSKLCKCEKAEIQKLLKDKGALDNLDTVREPLIITSPKNGDTFKEGDTVKLVAELSNDDPEILYVDFDVTKGLDHCPTGLTTHPRYECSFKIPPGSPQIIEISATGKKVYGAISSPWISIKVILPPNITLQQLQSFTGNRLFFSRLNENHQIYLKGIFSDGVKRDVWSASTGTTYNSSDEKVVTVNSDGLVTAKGPGKASITAVNGDKELFLYAIVKPKP